MKMPDQLVSELAFSDPSTHFFTDCRFINKPYGKRVLGVYGQRLDACNWKIRFAAKAYLGVQAIVAELEHGEFIYFDDESRLEMGFYTESFLVFLRACLDLAISAYYAYFTGKTDLDSFNDFVKKLNTAEWLPESSREFWSVISEDYKTEEFYTWIQTLV